MNMSKECPADKVYNDTNLFFFFKSEPIYVFYCKFLRKRFFFLETLMRLIRFMSYDRRSF